MAKLTKIHKERRKIMKRSVFTIVVLLTLSALMTACGASRTYSGVLKRTRGSVTESNVKITVSKSESEGTMQIKSVDSNSKTFLEDCLYGGIKIERSKAPGGASWYPVVCGVKAEFGEEVVSFSGDIDFVGNKMKMKTTASSPTHGESTFEFEGTEN